MRVLYSSCWHVRLRGVSFCWYDLEHSMTPCSGVWSVTGLRLQPGVFTYGRVGTPSLTLIHIPLAPTHRCLYPLPLVSTSPFWPASPTMPSAAAIAAPAMDSVSFQRDILDILVSDHIRAGSSGGCDPWPLFLFQRLSPTRDYVHKRRIASANSTTIGRKQREINSSIIIFQSKSNSCEIHMAQVHDVGHIELLLQWLLLALRCST